MDSNCKQVIHALVFLLNSYFICTFFSQCAIFLVKTFALRVDPKAAMNVRMDGWTMKSSVAKVYSIVVYIMLVNGEKKSLLMIIFNARGFKFYTSLCFRVGMETGRGGGVEADIIGCSSDRKKKAKLS